MTAEHPLVPAQVKGTVLTVRRVDAYFAMTVIAPGVAARFRPGQFVAVAVGGPETVTYRSKRMARRRGSRHLSVVSIRKFAETPSNMANGG